MENSSAYCPAPKTQLREHCGIFGVYNHPQASLLAYYGLYALQHRGQESAGIVSADGRRLMSRKGMGLVGDVFKASDFKELKGHMACGHVRYSTTGASSLANVQPLLVFSKQNDFSLAHNGNLTNASDLRADLEKQGSIFQGDNDTEVVAHLLARKLHLGFSQAFISSLQTVNGAYGFILMSKDALYAARDPYGFRPLSLGRLGGAYVLASENCAFDLINAQYIRDIEPGEMIAIDGQGLKSLRPFPAVEPKQCVFEHVYFARPDSAVFGQSVYMTRRNFGRKLHEENPALKADFIMPFPDSGSYAALGYSQASGIPLELAMIRNHYVGRSFIQPSQAMRDFSVKVKLNPMAALIKGKDIIVLDDSIVRGTTALNRIRSLRRLGAQKIRMLVSSPPCMWPCRYGVDFAQGQELAAARHSLEEVRTLLELDSLHYLSIAGMQACLDNPRHYCLACFDGHYPQ